MMESDLLARLGNLSLSATVTVIIVFLVCRLFARLPSAVRCWIWWLVCLKILLGLVVLPWLSLAVLPEQSKPPALESLPSPSRTTAISASASEDQGAVVSGGPMFSSPSGGFSFSLSQCLLAVWLIGIGAGIGAQGMALVHLRRLSASAVRQKSSVLADAARRAALRFVPALWVSPSPVEPLTVGGPRPRLLLSSNDFARLSEEELRAILTHECFHIRRGDLLLSFVPALALTLFWFLPPVYLALREFELAREAACDERTLAALGLSPRIYGELLVKLSSPATPLPTPSSVMALSAGFRCLKRRIEMLNVKPSRRLLLAALLVLPALIPWGLTTAAPPFAAVALPNLDFADGLNSWHKNANGSDTVAHPFYSVGTDTKITRDGKPVGYVKANANIGLDKPGNGGVLRYDLPAEKYQGKRLRWSGFVQGVGLKQQAFLFVCAQGTTFPFAKSTQVTFATAGWQKRECVIDVPSDAAVICLGLRLEGDGTAYGSGFKLEVVDKTVPLTTTVVDLAGASEGFSPPQNLTFAKGLDGWWNDNPDHNAESDYTMALSKGRGRGGGSAAYLKNKAATPRSYGTIAQNASADDYKGKRIRLSAYLRSENAKAGDLWIVVHDKDREKTVALNGMTTAKVIQGTQDWTRFEHTVDIPATTQRLSFGVSSEGVGIVWVDGFKIEVLGSVAKPQ